MKTQTPMALLAFVLLAGCTADPGGSSSAGGGGNGGGGDGGGGDCLIRDPVTDTCILGPGTDLVNYTCTSPDPAGSVASAVETGVICGLGAAVCTVENEGNAADQDFDSFATIDYAVGALDPLLGGSTAIAVELPGAVSAGNVAAFLVEFAGGVVDAGLLRTLSVTTTMNGVVQEQAALDSLLALDVIGLIPGTGKVLVGFHNTMSYNGASIGADATLAAADVTGSLRVYEACIAATPAAP